MTHESQVRGPQNVLARSALAWQFRGPTDWRIVRTTGCTKSDTGAATAGWLGYPGRVAGEHSLRRAEGRAVGKSMRITRLRATIFRGWAELDPRPAGQVLVVGEPRAGRTDLVLALTRVLDPRSTRAQPSIADIHQQATYPSTETSEGATKSGDSEAMLQALAEGAAAESPVAKGSVALASRAPTLARSS